MYEIFETKERLSADNTLEAQKVRNTLKEHRVYLINLMASPGAGKTTIIKLLCRLYQPTEGRILLNGIDIQKFDFNEYTKIFSPVFQDFGMFNISAKENLEGGHHNEEKDINAIIADVGLEKRFTSGQDGLDCVLED